MEKDFWQKALKKITFTNICKALGAAIILTVVGMLAFRLYTLNHYPAFARGVLPTESLQTAYRAGTLSADTWELSAEFDATGDFWVHQPIYFANEKTLIVTVRYNDSVLTELKHDGDGASLPIDVTLYADGTERIFPTTYSYGHAYSLYSYRRYVFEGVELSDYEYLYLDVYHGEADYNVAPYASIGVFDAKQPIENYKLTWADKKALQ